jgi:beta-mannosidase
MANLVRVPLSEGWKFKQAHTEDDLLPVYKFPTTIHLDLLYHQKIPDPRKDLDSDKVQWVGEKSWLYQTTFGHNEDASREIMVLVFEGLDTHASITLNGDLLLKTDNMFLEYRVDVSKKLKANNTLEILFGSTFLIGKALEKAQGFKNLFWNGDSSRMNVRKVPCHYGWDWSANSPD